MLCECLLSLSRTMLVSWRAEPDSRTSSTLAWAAPSVEAKVLWPFSLRDLKCDLEVINQAQHMEVTRVYLSHVRAICIVLFVFSEVFTVEKAFIGVSLRSEARESQTQLLSSGAFGAAELGHWDHKKCWCFSWQNLDWYCAWSIFKRNEHLIKTSWYSLAWRSSFPCSLSL